MSHVDPQRRNGGVEAIEPEDLPRIMGLIAQQCSMIVDLAGDVEANAEALQRRPLKPVVNG